MSMGELQAAVLGVLQRLRRASARQVQEEIGREREIAYTTVGTVLDRLYRKGLVGRKKQSGRGGRYIYFYTTPEKVRNSLVERALSQLVSAFGPSVVPTIYSSLEVISKTESKKSLTRTKHRRKAP
jgi:predicted transcriptional regulator